MKLVVDMNLSPRWVAYLEARAISAIHWSSVGRADAPDSEIMAYASENGMIVLTHDLDFSAILAATRQNRPSVVQIRAAILNPERIGNLLVAALKQMEEDLSRGALLTVDLERTRLRLLPFPTR